jgi:hypothetical protein
VAANDPLLLTDDSSSGVRPPIRCPLNSDSHLEFVHYALQSEDERALRGLQPEAVHLHV